MFQSCLRSDNVPVIEPLLTGARLVALSWTAPWNGFEVRAVSDRFDLMIGCQVAIYWLQASTRKKLPHMERTSDPCLLQNLKVSHIPPMRTSDAILAAPEIAINAVLPQSNELVLRIT